MDVLDGPSLREAAHACDARPIVSSEFGLLLSGSSAAACSVARARALVGHDECDRDRDRLRHLARGDGGRRAVGPRRQPGRVDAERADSRELVGRDGGLTRQRDEPRGAARRVRVRELASDARR